MEVAAEVGSNLLNSNNFKYMGESGFEHFDNLTTRGFKKPDADSVDRAHEPGREEDMALKNSLDGKLKDIASAYREAIVDLRTAKAQASFSDGSAGGRALDAQLIAPLEAKVSSLKQQWGEEELKLTAVHLRLGLERPNLSLDNDPASTETGH